MTANLGIYDGVQRPAATPLNTLLTVQPGDWVLPSSQRGSSGYTGRATSSNATNSNNTADFVPFYLNASFTIAAMAIHCVTANDGANAVVRLGLYADSDGRPGTVAIDAGTQSINATGVKTMEFSPVTLAPGWYWTVLVPQGLNTAGTNPTFSSGSGGGLQMAGTASVIASNNLFSKYYAIIAGSLRDTPPMGRDQNGHGGFNIFLRRSSR